jgi:ribosome-associated protein
MKPDEDFTTPGMLVIPAAAMEWAFARSAGAGGQHINKTSSKATLTVATELVTGPTRSIKQMRFKLQTQVRTSSQKSRSQWRNRQHCLDRIAEMLDTAAKPLAPPRRKTKPSRGAVERRLESKHRDSKTKASRRSTDW